MAAMKLAVNFRNASERITRTIALLLRVALCTAVLGIPSIARGAATAERVSFASLDIDPQTGQPITISALYFKPQAGAASTTGRTPAVVALHGCGGMYREAPGQRDRLTARHQAMAELLVGEGYAVLFPDSFNPRGRREICSLRLPDQQITQDNRRLDVLAALDYLRARPDIDSARIALLGWSHGGSAVLATMNRHHPVVAQFLDADQPRDMFYRTAIAFYPGCINAMRTRFRFAPASPVSIFIGTSDDWTSPKPCIALGERMAAAKEPVQVRTYPDTYHGFDSPNMFAPLHLDVPNGVYPGQGVTIAPNPAARDDAYSRMKAQLRAALGP